MIRNNKIQTQVSGTCMDELTAPSTNCFRHKQRNAVYTLDYAWFPSQVRSLEIYVIPYSAYSKCCYFYDPLSTLSSMKSFKFKLEIPTLLYCTNKKRCANCRYFMASNDRLYGDTDQ